MAGYIKPEFKAYVRDLSVSETKAMLQEERKVFAGLIGKKELNDSDKMQLQLFQRNSFVLSLAQAMVIADLKRELKECKNNKIEGL